MSERPRDYAGGCHCGRVRFRVTTSRDAVLDCSCTICTMKAYVHLIVPPEAFVLERGADSLSTYTFNTRVAKHHFCATCGVAPFYRPRSHPGSYDVNARCLDGEALSDFRVEGFDGARWEENVATIR